MNQIDDQEQEIIKILFAHVQQEKSTTITFGKLIALIKGYAQKFYKEKNSLIGLAHSTESTLTAALEKLEKNNQVLLRKNSNDEIITVNYVGFHHTLIHWWYRKFSADIETPFPGRKQFGLSIPESQIKHIELNQGLLEHFDEYEHYEGILEVHFEEDIPEIMITPNIFCNQLELICLQKLGHYMERRKGSMQIYQTLYSNYDESLQAKKIIEGLAKEPQAELQRIRSPSEKTFMLWTMIHGSIMSTIDEEDLSNTSTQSYFQAVAFIYNFVLYYYEEAKKNIAQQHVHDFLTEKMTQPPYIYSYAELVEAQRSYTALQESITTDEFQKELEILVTQDSDSGELMLDQFIGLNGKRYFTLTKNIATVLSEQMEKLKVGIRMDFRNTLAEHLQRRQAIPEFLASDTALEHATEQKVKEKDPLLYVMLNYHTVHKALSANKDNPDQALATQEYELLSSLIHKESESLLPYTEIFEIDIVNIKKEARYLVPFWAKIPGLSLIVKFLKSLLDSLQSKRSETQDASMASKQSTDGSGDNQYSALSRGPSQHKFASKNMDQMSSEESTQIKELKEAIGSKREAEEQLRRLNSAWNPILGEPQRSDLTSDVNVLCRDMLRSMWNERMSKVPDSARIRDMATRISENTVFNKVQEKKKLNSYIELYLAYTTLQKLNML